MFKAVDNFLNNSEKKVDTVDPEAPVEQVQPVDPGVPEAQVEPAVPVEKVDLVEVKVDKEPFSLSQMFFNFFVKSFMCSSKSSDVIVESNKPLEIDSSVI